MLSLTKLQIGRAEQIVLSQIERYNSRLKNVQTVPIYVYLYLSIYKFDVFFMEQFCILNANKSDFKAFL